MAAKVPLFFMVNPVDEYGQLRLIAELVKRAEDDGSLVSLDYHFPDAGLRALSSLRVTAYIGEFGYGGAPDRDPGRVWGERLTFKPHSIDRAEEAQNIARAFAKIERGLTKLRDAEGHPNDFATLLVHVARVLKIDRFQLRTHARAQEMTGERYRETKGGDVADWVRWLAKDVSDGKRHEWLR